MKKLIIAAALLVATSASADYVVGFQFTTKDNAGNPTIARGDAVDLYYAVDPKSADVSNPIWTARGTKIVGVDKDVPLVNAGTAQHPSNDLVVEYKIAISNDVAEKHFVGVLLVSKKTGAAQMANSVVVYCWGDCTPDAALASASLRVSQSFWARLVKLFNGAGASGQAIPVATHREAIQPHLLALAGR